MSILAIVPARGGSRGLPGKNLRLVDGVSLVARAIACGRLFATGSRAAVLLDTDSEEIAAEGRKWGAQVPFLRPAHLAADTTSSYDSVEFALRRWEETGGPVDVLVLLQPTSPFRTPGDVTGCVERLGASSPSVISVVRSNQPPEFAFRMTDSHRLEWAFGNPRVTRRQDLARSWHPNGAVYAQTPEFLREHRTFVVAGVTQGVEMPPERSVDIDSALDLATARSLARNLHAGPPRRLLDIDDGSSVDLGLLARSGSSGCYLRQHRVRVSDEALAGMAARARDEGLLVVAEMASPAEAPDMVIPSIDVTAPLHSGWSLRPGQDVWLRTEPGIEPGLLVDVLSRAVAGRVTLASAPGPDLALALGIARLAGCQTAILGPWSPEPESAAPDFALGLPETC